MKDVIILSGAPGSGKSSLARLLKEKLDSVEISFSAFRNFHLDSAWKKKSPEEEQLSFENFLFVVRNYLSHGYHNIIVHDFQDFRIADVATEFKNSIILTLTADNDEIEERIVRRDEGWKDVEKAIQWNEKLKTEPLLPHEHRIDTTRKDPTAILEEALDFIES